MGVRERGARSAGSLALAGSLVALVAACQPTPPPTVPTPTPTVASPSENEQERRERLDREAAEKAYLVTRSAAEKLAMAGGADEPDRTISENTSGAYLRLMMTDLGVLKKNGWRTDRPTTTFVSANRGWSPDEVGLTACEDASEVKLLDAANREVEKNRPRLFVQELTASKSDGRWRISGVDSKIVKSFQGVAVCEP